MSNLDKIRLEIAAPGQANEITNHSGQGGTTTGWQIDSPWPALTTLTAVSGLAYGHSGKAIRLGSTQTDPADNFPAGIDSPVFNVVPGEFVNFAVTVRPLTRNVRLYATFKFYNASNALISTSTANSVVLSAGTTNTVVGYVSGGGGTVANIPSGITAPVGSVTARVWFQMWSDAPIGPCQSDLWHLMIVTGTGLSSVNGVTFSESDPWSNVIQGCTSINIKRGGSVDGVTDHLDVGTLTASFRDPLLNPALNDRVRPGWAIRCTALTDAGVWEPIYSGTIRSPRVTHERTGSGGIHDVVTLTAVDAMNVLQSASHPVGKSGTFKQRVISALEDVPVTYDIDDTDPNTTQKDISLVDNGTALGLLELIRDSLQGVFYVGKENYVHAMAANSYPTQTPVVTFTDNAVASTDIAYVDLDEAFDPEQIINTLTVRRTNLAEEDGEKVYGPYTNEDSVEEWGVFSAELNVNDSIPSELAADYLSLFADPTYRVSSVTYNVRPTDDFALAAERDLYEAVGVEYSPSSIDTVSRIIGLEHTITPDNWSVSVDLKPLESTSSITVTNPTGGADAGPQDQLSTGFPRIAQQARYVSADISIPSGTSTAASFADALIVDNAIPYNATTREFTITRTGRYFVGGQVNFSANATGVRVLDIYVNGTAVARGRINSWSGTSNIVRTTDILKLSDGDVVKFMALQNSGSTLTIGGSSSECRATVAYIGPA